MNENKDIRLEVAGEFYLSPIVRADKAAYLEVLRRADCPESVGHSVPLHERRTPKWSLDRCEQSVGSPMTNFALRAPSGYLIGAIGVVRPPMRIAQSFGYVAARSLIAGTVLCLASSAQLQRLYAFNSSEFMRFLLRLSPPTLLRTAHWRRRGFNAKGYSDITTSSKAYISMQLSMDAFLTPMKTPYQSMTPTAPFQKKFSELATLLCRGLSRSC